ncbi:MAG: type B DNA-directed DNA polymerase [Methanothrix sp.]|jgi:DNA polymerase I|uniref:type B DNA-directed DNA polymerase n=1 Tax=Methanothrix sp. TaxID=90426 RepID=UPI001BD38EF3
MWIFDSYYKGSVELWGRENGPVKVSAPFPHSFYMHLRDPPAHREMLAALEDLYRVEEGTFRTIFGPLEGYRIFAGRKVAEKIEIQTRYSAQLYNVDVRHDQWYMAKHDLFPCGEKDESRFSPDFPIPLTSLQIEVKSAKVKGAEGAGGTGGGGARRAEDAEDAEGTGSSPLLPGAEITSIQICRGKERRLDGPERRVIADLMELIRSYNPDLILFPYADNWVPAMLRKAERYGIEPAFSRSGWFKSMAPKSYWSYGRANHKEGALIPEGRVLIDTARSFVYREGGLKGVLMASRLTGLSPNLTSRFTPGTLISSYEVFEALRRGVAVPFRKNDAESTRRITDLRACDRGGMMFQPHPGVYEQVYQIDFTSLYPSIIVKYNLSPESLEHPEVRGFLATVISSLLDLRIETKKRKKTDPEYRGIDSVLKWMLVTCFGYTGYRNAKFGQIQVHERITAISRDLLMDIKELAEDMDFEVLHGIVDCLWVRGGSISNYQEAVEQMTGILTEVDSFDWIAFLPMADGWGSYTRYFGRLDNGEMKARGVAARRGDTPHYVKRMQTDLLGLLARAESREELHLLRPEAEEVHRGYRQGLMDARVDLRELAVRRRLSRTSYIRRCAEASALQALKSAGRRPAAGMEVGYVVADARRWEVDLVEEAAEYDAQYYEKLLDKAWEEVAFVFGPQTE